MRKSATTANIQNWYFSFHGIVREHSTVHWHVHMILIFMFPSLQHYFNSKKLTSRMDFSNGWAKGIMRNSHPRVFLAQGLNPSELGSSEISLSSTAHRLPKLKPCWDIENALFLSLSSENINIVSTSKTHAVTWKLWLTEKWII